MTECEDNGFHSFNMQDSIIDEESFDTMSIIVYCKKCNAHAYGKIEWETYDE